MSKIFRLFCFVTEIRAMKKSSVTFFCAIFQVLIMLLKHGEGLNNLSALSGYSEATCFSVVTFVVQCK